MRWLLMIVWMCLGAFEGSCQDTTFIYPDSNYKHILKRSSYNKLRIKKSDYLYEINFFSTKNEGILFHSNFIDLPPLLAIEFQPIISYRRDTLFLYKHIYAYYLKKGDILLPLNANQGDQWECNAFGRIPGYLKLIEKKYIESLHDHI